MGAYPDASLADARQQRDGIRKLLVQNINPAQQRIAKRVARSQDKSFQSVALSWHKSNRIWSENHASRLLASLHNHIFPVIGHMPVAELKPRHFIALLKGIEQKGLLEVAARTRQHMCNIMRHAVHQELIENNPAANLEGIITPPVKRHYPALPLERLPELLIRIKDYQQGRELTRLAVSLTLHLFIRSSELRFARWSEIDIRNKIWTIPATREAIPGVRYSRVGSLVVSKLTWTSFRLKPHRDNHHLPGGGLTLTINKRDLTPRFDLNAEYVFTRLLRNRRHQRLASKIGVDIFQHQTRHLFARRPGSTGHMRRDHHICPV